MSVFEKEFSVGDVKTFKKRLNEKGYKIRYFKKAESVIDAIQQLHFKPYIERDKPAIYIKPYPEHDAPFVIQSNRILTIAANEARARELIDIFIFKHLKKKE